MFDFPEGGPETLTTRKFGSQTLHVREHRGAGRPLLFLHGYPTSGIDWRLIAYRFADRHCLYPDLLGFGLSDKPRIRYTFPHHRQLVEALLHSRGIREIDIVAHDYSVTLAQELLHAEGEGRLPFRIGRVVLLNGGIYPEHHRARPIQKLLRAPLVGEIVAGAIGRDALAKALRRIAGSPDAWTEWAIDEHFEAIAHNDGQKRLASLLTYVDDRRIHREPWVAAMHRAIEEGRMSFVWGPLDPVSGGHVLQALRERTANPEIREIEGAGHYPHWEKPEEAGAAIVEALR
ncbi:alpha/beta fold hydrolase [Parvularcula lutaonensis]|uniref:Alpha/beta fold hydrolase n=1 Tax=Parvularcula lutaonensis TaxID=491923 RepID=A0ABV7M7H8_9PROT|nr:alpha/beta fold hydrolase [Parvularcula lutaonensis]GGY42039.1 epoxide hydrolase [Parvularcula lutaonensis]